MTMTTPLVRNAEEAERRWFYGGGLHSWLVREREVGDGFLLFEDVVEPGKRTPLHIHPGADETFYLLAGSIAAARRRNRAGAAVRRGRRDSRATSRMPSWPGPTVPGCCACTPRAVARASTGPPANRPSTGEPALPVDFDRIREAAVATGTMQIVGPPPF